MTLYKFSIFSLKFRSIYTIGSCVKMYPNPDATDHTSCNLGVEISQAWVPDDTACTRLSIAAGNMPMNSGAITKTEFYEAICFGVDGTLWCWMQDLSPGQERCMSPCFMADSEDIDTRDSGQSFIPSSSFLVAGLI